MIFEKLSQVRDEASPARVLLIVTLCYTSWLVGI